MSSPVPLRTLILEDNQSDLELIIDRLTEAGFQPNWVCVDSQSGYLGELHPDVDIILSDYSMPQFNALEALHLLQICGWDIPFIVVTGSVSEEVAVECMKQGASDYLLKDRLARLGQAVHQALQGKQLRDEKRQAEAALRKSAAFSQSVLNSLTAHIAVINEQGDITAINEAWVRFARENGADESARLGLGANFFDICRQAAQSGDQESLQVLENVLAVLDGRQSGFIQEIPCHSPTEQRWYSMRVTPLSEGMRGAVISYTDISERMRISLSLERELKLLRTLIDNIPDAIFIKDTADRFIDANLETVARMGVVIVNELIGKTDFDFYPPEIAVRYFMEDLQVLRSGESIINREERGIDLGTGQERWLLTAKIPLLDKEEQITGLVGIARDITERRQAEQNLRKSEQRFSKAFNASPVPIYIAHLDNSIMIDANDSFLSFSGYRRDNVIGHTARDLKIWHTPDNRLEYLPENFLR